MTECIPNGFIQVWSLLIWFDKVTLQFERLILPTEDVKKFVTYQIQ